MSNRLIKKFTKCKEGSLGYTLMEMLVVIGIIAIICAIAIPSVVSIVKSLRFAQRNDYAKSIFMAAQANLTEMRADGGLAPLQQAGLDSLPVQEEICGFPVEDWSPEYVYTSSEDSQKVSYALVLPVGSVDGTLREQQVIIEYNPLTGNVYAVFYSEEKDQNILQDYRDGKLPRNGEGDEKLRKEMMLGYYDGSGLSSAELEIERTEARITFENGEEGIVTVHIPMPDLYVGSHEEFMKGLEVKLDITGEINKGKIEDIVIKQSGTVGDNCKLAVDGKTVEVTYVLDSLANRMSFANLAAGTRANPNAAQSMSGTGTSLTAVMNESSFRILPGENVTLDAEVTFTAANDRPNVAVQNAKLGGVNPMFGYLTKNLDNDKYTLTIENGRNLQNLNAIAPSVANKISSVAFTKDIYWNQTVAYYNQHYPQPGGYQNNADEAPARALPYFVPIHNENLFGTARFIFMDGSEDEQTFLQTILGWLIGSDFKRNDRVPTLTDEVDSVKDASGKYVPVPHATIDGGGYGVYYLNINSNLYQVPNATNAANKGKFYATGEHQIIDYHFTGLFGYVNTPISDLSVVNPIVKGHDFEDTTSGGKISYSNPATGALVGACGFNTYLYNCSSYLDTKADGFNWSYAEHGTVHPQSDFTADGDQKWYGVSGAGAVGGLVGYAKSHRTTNGAMSDDSKVLAFNRCFAAVPVSGTMRGNGNKDFGYSNGVGGLIGNSQLTNFYNCYASGNVRVSNTYYSRTTNTAGDTLQTLLGLGGNGRLGMGGGGFVGTSHGTRYTNCFSASNVTRVSGNGDLKNAGGFVGMMCYDETKAYGHHSGNSTATVAQHTVFESCYAVGICREDKPDRYGNVIFLESFAGATGTINVTYSGLEAYQNADYYLLYAPFFVLHETDPLYQMHYIFKDSYYLSQHEDHSNVSQDESKKCANSITYSDLVDLHWKYDTASWIQGKIDNIKTQKLTPKVIQVLGSVVWDIFEDAIKNIFNGGGSDLRERLTKITDILKQNNPTYQIYFQLYEFLSNEGLKDYDYSLEEGYRNRFGMGFPAYSEVNRNYPWETPRESNTHYYGEADTGMVYPFPKIHGLDYYGIWPAEPLTGGLAYYEYYENENGTRSYGYYFDRADTSSLRSTEDTVILHDGYAVFSGTEYDTIRILDAAGNPISGYLSPEENAITLSSPFSPDDKSYHVTRIPDEVFSNLTPGGEGFYSAIRIEVSNDSGTDYFWALFNPNTGISQVNNVQFNGNNIVYRENPSDVMIRTARQLNALSSDTMQDVWNDPDITFIQQLHINAATYDWNNDGNVLNETIPVLGSIGSETKPFCATYSGSAGYVGQAKIEGFDLKNPIFGYIGTGTKTTQTTDETTGETVTTTTIVQGKVEDLSIIVQSGTNGTTIGKTTDDYTALVAAVCSGDLENVDLTITGNVTLKAKTAAGLLVGYIFGSEDDLAEVIGCDITADTLSVSATNAGAVIGQAEYCDIRQGVDSENLPDDLTLNLTGKLTLKGIDVGAYLGLTGDLNADKTIGEVNVDGLTLTLNGMEADAVRAGALAGTLEKGDIKNLKVTLAGAYTATGEDSVMAGVAAVAKNGLVQGVTVNVNGTLTGDTAAGVFGTAENLTVQTTEVNVNSTITGTQAAAGLAASIEGGNFSGVNVKLMNATIIANGTEEVTTEGTTAEDGTVTPSTTAIVPTGRAAGFAVEIHGQVETGLVITPNAYTTNGTAAQITGNAEAAGFACEITAQVTGSRVAGKLNITSNGEKTTTAEGGTSQKENVGLAAGFAVKIAGTNLTINTNGVTPALENTAEGYKKAGSNNNLTVNGGNAAMFAVEIGSGVNVRNCYVLGRLTGTDLSGFAVTNGGAIDGCSANVTLSGGNAFVRENTGSISNSYGWYGNGVEKDAAEADVTTATIEGTVISSYFVDIDVPATNDNKSADIYNANKEHRTDSPLKLTANELNGETGSRWFAAATYGAYPYSKLVPATYSYPMLRVHYGNWATPPRYAYGVMYYEQYKDGSWKVEIKDMSDVGSTVEKASLTGYYTYDEITDQSFVKVEGNVFNNEGEITKAGYAVFFKDETVGEKNLPANLVLNGATLGNGIVMPLSQNAKYTVYPLTNPASSITLTDKAVYKGETDEAVTMGGWYAHEFNPTETTVHVIRTEGQLANVAATGSYSQTHDIILGSDFDLIETFSGVYNGGGLRLRKSGSVNGWMGAVTGSIENVDLVLGDLNASFFGNVSGTIALKDVYLASVAENANLINTLSGTLTCPVIEVGGDLAGKVIGTANAAVTNLSVKAQSISGAVIGTVSAEKNVDMSLTCSGEVSGSIVDTVNGSFTLNNNPNFGTVSGHLFDTVTGNVTLSNGISVDTLSGSLVQNMGTVDESGNVTGTGTVTTNAVSIGTLDGSLVYALNGGTVNTGAVTVGTLSGSLVQTMGAVDANGNVTGTGTMTTGAIKVDTLNASLVTTFNGGTLSGANNQITVQITGENGITVPIFADVLGGTVKNYVVSGNVTLGGTAKGALVNTNNGTLSGLTLRAASISVTAADNTVGGLVGTNGTDGDITNCVVEGTAANTTATVTITGAESKALTFGGLVGENSGDITDTTKVNANITYIQPINPAEDKKDSATIGGLVGKMTGGSLNGATVSGSIELTNVEQIEAAAAIAEAEEQGIELVEELNPAPVVSNRNYIIGGAVGNLLAGSASGTEANVVVVSVWAGAEQTSPDTFGTSGITNRGPVGMFVGFAGAVTIENCASTETTNETFQFLGEALLEPVTLTNMWKSDVKKDSPVKAYSDSITDGVYKSYDPAGIFFSAAANVMRVTPTLSGCYFEFDGATMEQTYSEDEYFYSQTSAKENVYSIGTTAVAPSFASKSITLKSSDWDSTPKTTEYYYLHNNGSYYQVSVKYTESGPWYNKTRKFILVETGNESNVLTELNASGSISDWDYIATVTLHTLSLPNLSGTYITINADNKAIDSTWTPYDLTNDRTFNQRDVLLACVWTVSGNTITNVKDGTVYQVTATFNKSGTLIMTYAVGDVMFHMYPVTVTSNASTYDVLTFTYQNNVDYQRQYVKAVPFEGNGITSITESDLPADGGEATQGTEVPEATGTNETATVPPAAEDGKNN